MRLFCTLVFVVHLLSLSAQLSYQNHPPKLKWYKIETEHVQIVFPQGLDSVAQRTANLTNHIYAPVTKTLNIQPRKLSFFLFNQSAMSNGYVTPIHPMMAWYTTPMPEIGQLGSGDWFQTLAVHEYRHVAQFEKMDQHATHLAKIFYGAYGASALGIISHPLWFAEGDAVLTETALTNGGRGRSPSFSMRMRAFVMEDVPHSYDKVYGQSFQHFYPNHYTLGYYMNTYGRRNYGDSFWSNILNETSYRSFSPYYFSKAMRYQSGYKVDAFYTQAINELRPIWQELEANRRYTQTETLNTQQKQVYTSYIYPQSLNDSTIVSVKSGFDAPSQFILLSSGEEKRLFVRDPNSPFSLKDSVMVWTEYGSDIRYGERSYSDVYRYDFRTQKQHRITQKQKLFSPSLSEDGLKIVAVEYTEQMQCSIVILDAVTGAVLNKIYAKPGEFFRTPSWSENGEAIVCAVGKSEDNWIDMITLVDGSRTTLYGPTYDGIGKPSLLNGSLLFNSPETGIDAVHAINLSNQKHFVVAQTRFGASNVCAYGDQLVFQNYSSKGFSLEATSANEAHWQLYDTVKKQAEDYFLPVVAQEQGGSIFQDSIRQDTFAIRKYSQIKNLINIHSWGFLPSNESLSFFVASDDKLANLSTQAAILYNVNEHAFSESIGLSFSRYFPVLSITAINGIRTGTFEIKTDSNTDSLNFKNTNRKTDTSGMFHWQEQSLQLGVEFPFNFSKPHRMTTLSLKFFALYKQTSDNDLFERSKLYVQKDGVIVPLQGKLLFVNAQMPSYRDLQPNWGQVVQIHTEYCVPGWSDFGTVQVDANFQEFFPGIRPSHGTRLFAGVSLQDQYNPYYSAPSYMAFTRGHEFPGVKQWANTSLNYRFPLFYPDQNIGGTVYFKRVWAEAFVDVSKDLETNDMTGYYRSVGVDVNVDFNLFRWIFLPINMGVRASYNIETDEKVFEMLIFGQGL